jgi:hypothetical protein
MVCDHLRALEEELLARGVAVTHRGRAWTRNCREWVYFDVVLDTEALARRFDFAPVVRVHENTDPRSGLERGFECTECHDAVMGLVEGPRVFR